MTFFFKPEIWNENKTTKHSIFFIKKPNPYNSKFKISRFWQRYHRAIAIHDILSISILWSNSRCSWSVLPFREYSHGEITLSHPRWKDLSSNKKRQVDAQLRSVRPPNSANFWYSVAFPPFPFITAYRESYMITPRITILLGAFSSARSVKAISLFHGQAGCIPVKSGIKSGSVMWSKVNC